MGTGLGWLSIAAAIALALARLSRLLAAEGPGVSWPVILAAGAVLGAVMAAAVISARLPSLVGAPLQLIGSFLAVARVATPGTLAAGFLPTSETIPALRQELEVAAELVRYGAAPVIPLAGLVGLLTFVFWWLGALAAYGGLSRRVMVGAVPALLFYLQLATLDRRGPGLWWTAAFAGAAGLTLLAATSGRRRRGLARGSGGAVLPARGMAVPALALTAMLVGALGATGALAAAVPESGTLHWRNATGFGGGLLGGVSINLFVSLQQDIVSQSDEPVFVARVGQSAPPNHELYWKLITLDYFDGENWLPGDLPIKRPAPGEPWESEAFAFRGPTTVAEQVVQIRSLRQNYLPVLHSPVRLSSDVELLSDSYRVREDGSVKFDARTYEGLTYRLTSEIPQPDLAALASPNGTLSPIFASAVDAGAIDLRPADRRAGPAPSRVLDLYLDLPDRMPDEIRKLASEVTAGASTGFERAVLLEAFFRSSGLFRYDATISTGHTSLDLADWLTAPASRNYRTGYCEQFATAMAVMGRVLGIPSRVVVGFTPGTVQQQSDGSELIVVGQRNAHAWVEMYFSGQGWIRFDPTPRADGVNPATTARLGFDPNLFLPEPSELGPQAASGGLRPDLTDRLLEEGADPTLGLPSGAGLRVAGWIAPPLGLLGILSLLPAIKLVRRRRRIRRLREGDITAAWAEITDRLRDLGHRIPVSETPLEVAAGLGAAMVPLAAKYTRAVYGEMPVAGGDEALRAAEADLRHRYRAGRRALAWLHPRSLGRH